MNYSCYTANHTVSLQLVMNILHCIILSHCVYME